MITIRRGLDLPISGEPDSSKAIGAKSTGRVGVVGPDFVGMKPTMHVAVGDKVRRGQLLFEDKKNAGVRHVAPAAGEVVEVNRGAKRVFQSVVIATDGSDDQVEFESHADPSALSRDVVRESLLASGLWTAIRARPYGKTAVPDSVPSSIFVQAIDTNPLAADPAPLVKARPEDFRYGLQALSHLTDGPLHLCCRPEAELPGRELEFVRVDEFAGPHPAGLPGTHIHFLDPVGEGKTVWYLNYADVMDIGRFITSGRLPTTRVISLAGPAVKEPRLVEVPIGVCLDEIIEGELVEDGGDVRVVSGSVLHGRTSEPFFNYLGRYATQVTALAEGNVREFLGWQGPGFEKFSIRKIFASAANPFKKFAMSTSTHGSPRAMVPIGVYEDIMPLDVEPTYLLRSLIVGDTEQLQKLGGLELEEEDLALCTFVDPGKTAYGPMLRERLTLIEKEG